MWYPVKLAEEAGGVHKILKLPGCCGSCSAVRSLGWSAAVHRKNNACDSHNSSAVVLHHSICIKLHNAAIHFTFFCSYYVAENLAGIKISKMSLANFISEILSHPVPVASCNRLVLQLKWLRV